MFLRLAEQHRQFVQDLVMNLQALAVVRAQVGDLGRVTRVELRAAAAERRVLLGSRLGAAADDVPDAARPRAGDGCGDGGLPAAALRRGAGGRRHRGCGHGCGRDCRDCRPIRWPSPEQR